MLKMSLVAAALMYSVVSFAGSSSGGGSQSNGDAKSSRGQGFGGTSYSGTGTGGYPGYGGLSTHDKSSAHNGTHMDPGGGGAKDYEGSCCSDPGGGSNSQ